MDEIITAVAQRTGLSPEQARQAVDAVVAQLRARLPAALAPHLDSLLQGNAAGTSGANGAGGGLAGGLGGLAGEIGGMFGRK